MKKTFIKTKNVKRFVTLMEELQKLPSNIPKLALVYGDHGFGKSKTILWWATKNDAVYIRAAHKMTTCWLLRDITEELGETPMYLTQDNFNIVVRSLKRSPKVIIVDEVDYLIANGDLIETLRDIHDITGSPIVLVGMGAMDKKIARYKHLEDRLYSKLKFEQFNANDIKEILIELTDINFTDDAVEYLATRTNQFRQLVKLINKIEKLSQTNGFDEIDEFTLKGIINERSTAKVVQKVEQIYA